MDNIFTATTIFGALGVVVTMIVFYIATTLRQVVPTNEVHIIQSSQKSTSFGTDSGHGNTYYKWPSWLPIVGISVTAMPVSVFKLELQAYDAYDIGRVPFEVDVVAFFRIGDSGMAAQRVSSFAELSQQLIFVMRGAVRTILASEDINKIMVERATFGAAFTAQVDEQLKNWGVHTVKNIELMDIRDTGDNQVIHNIMNQKKSQIEMESRSVVADNMKKAKIAEIAANRDAMVEAQQAEEAIGNRTAQKNQQIGIANEKANQAVRDEQKISKQKEMDVLAVAEGKRAEIDKNVQIIKAEQAKQTTILGAEATLEARKKDAEAIQVQGEAQANIIRIQGEAKADAEKALQMAPVQAQIALAQEVGQNEGYQTYLTTVKSIEANQNIGMEQAKALTAADVKVIVNGGTPAAGITNIMDLFSPKGGTQLGGFLEALVNTPEGEKAVKRFVDVKGGKAA